MKAFIVDDEKPAREELHWLLEQCPEVEVAGEAGDATSARQALSDPEVGGAVDLVFLDIDMPGVDGIRLAECLRELEEPPLTVFVTAYEEYAVDAFGVDAVDYLLKPVRLERLQKAVERARGRLGGSGDTERGSAAPEDSVEPPEDAADDKLDRISIEADGGYRVVHLEDVLFFESVDGEVVVQTADSRRKTDFSLKFLEQNLLSREFFRCHRSYIVRLDAIEHIEPAGAGTYRLHLKEPSNSEESSVPLARSRATELKKRMPWSASVVE